MAERIQRKRRGWVAPVGSVYVGRGSRWANPFRVVRAGACEVGPEIHSRWRNGEHWHVVWPDGERWCYQTKLEADVRVLELFWLGLNDEAQGLPRPVEVRELLEGQDLVCWCAPVAVCHGDVLLKVANG